jgi:hypothetical protein
MLHALAGNLKSRPRPSSSAMPSRAEVYADDEEPVSAEMANLIAKVAGAMITRIAADVHRYRATPPVIANTDGDPGRRS